MKCSNRCVQPSPPGWPRARSGPTFQPKACFTMHWSWCWVTAPSLRCWNRCIWMFLNFPGNRKSGRSWLIVWWHFPGQRHRRNPCQPGKSPDIRSRRFPVRRQPTIHTLPVRPANGWYWSATPCRARPVRTGSARRHHNHAARH